MVDSNEQQQQLKDSNSPALEARKQELQVLQSDQGPAQLLPQDDKDLPDQAEAPHDKALTSRDDLGKEPATHVSHLLDDNAAHGVSERQAEKQQDVQDISNYQRRSEQVR